jgi:hypothetical protein
MNKKESSGYENCKKKQQPDNSGGKGSGPATLLVNEHGTGWEPGPSSVAGTESPAGILSDQV